MIWGGRRRIFGRVTTAEGKSTRTHNGAVEHLGTGLAGLSRYDVAPTMTDREREYHESNQWGR